MINNLTDREIRKLRQLLRTIPCNGIDTYIPGNGIAITDTNCCHIKEITSTGQGPQGPQGPQGVQGEQGSQGVQGEQGNTGAQGAALTVLGSYPDLASFLAGAGGSPGLPGEAWIILSDGSLYVWNTDTNTWDDAGDLLGPEGPQGPTGLPGLFAQTALSTPVTFATGEQTLIGTGVGGLSVPANGFSIGDSFIVKMCGPITCANNQDIRIRVKTNGITLIDTGTFTIPQTTNKIWDLSIDFTITKIGGAGTAEIFANGLFSYNKNANNSIEGTNSSIINGTTFNTTISNTLSITAEWLNNNAANTIRTQNFTLTKVY